MGKNNIYSAKWPTPVSISFLISIIIAAMMPLIFRLMGVMDHSTLAPLMLAIPSSCLLISWSLWQLVNSKQEHNMSQQISYKPDENKPAYEINKIKRNYTQMALICYLGAVIDSIWEIYDGKEISSLYWLILGLVTMMLVFYMGLTFIIRRKGA